MVLVLCLGLERISFQPSLVILRHVVHASVCRAVFCVCIGSTALVAVIRGTELAVANVGDSRGVLCDMDGKSHPLSFDHKPHEVLLNLYFLFFI